MAVSAGAGRRRALGLIATAAAWAATPRRARATLRPQTAFAENAALAEALAALYGGRSLVPSDAVHIDTVAIAEDGAIVPVRVHAQVPRALGIALLAEHNPVPLIAVFELRGDLEPYLATRVKLGESGDLLAVVDTGEALLAARREVRVIEGGCA